MSKESLEQFLNQVAESKELQAKIGEEIDTESLITLGVEQGFEFTVEDLQENAELSDEELDTVAGGFGPSDFITRKQYAKMMVLSVDLPADDGHNRQFTDADTVSDWATTYVSPPKFKIRKR